MRNILPSQGDREPAPRANVLSHVAANVRRLRVARGISQVMLAKMSGMSRRMVVAIETNEANLSLSSLDRLAAALGASLTELVRPPEADDNRRIESIVWRGETPGSQAVLLGSAPATREAELWVWSLGEGERYPSEANSENWHEMILVIEGSLKIETSEEARVLPTGDFVIFTSARPYIFANNGQGTVRFVRNVVL